MNNQEAQAILAQLQQQNSLAFSSSNQEQKTDNEYAVAFGQTDGNNFILLFSTGLDNYGQAKGFNPSQQAKDLAKSLLDLAKKYPDGKIIPLGNGFGIRVWKKGSSTISTDNFNQTTQFLQSL